MPTDIQVKTKRVIYERFYITAKSIGKRVISVLLKIPNPASSNLEFWFPINYWKFVKVQSVQKQDFFPKTRK